MIKLLIKIVVPVALVIFCVGWYLQPNSLDKCGPSPSGVQGCQAVDAIIAISGGDTSARVEGAVELYNNGWAKTLIFSGAAQDKSGPSNAAVMKAQAVSAGVPTSNILTDEYSETTQQNAENSQTMFTQHNIKTIILVTSGYHQRRASLEFNKRANDMVILNYPVLSDKDWSFWWWATPRGWWLAISEIVKIGVFYVTGLWS